MSVTTHDIGFEALDSVEGVDSLCLFVSADERPLPGVAGYVDWRLCGGLSRVLRNGFFQGALGDQLLLPSSHRIAPQRIFAVGVGPAAALSLPLLQQSMRAAALMLTKAGVQGVALELPGAGVVPDPERAEALEKAFLPDFKGRVAVLAEKPLRALISSR